MNLCFYDALRNTFVSPGGARRAHHVEKSIEIEWFPQHRERGRRDLRRHGARRTDDDRNLRPRRMALDRLVELLAAHRRHEQVEQDRVGNEGSLREQGERVERVPRAVHVVPFAVQQRDERLANVIVVIDDEQLVGGHGGEWSLAAQVGIAVPTCQDLAGCKIACQIARFRRAPNYRFVSLGSFARRWPSMAAKASRSCSAYALCCRTGSTQARIAYDRAISEKRQINTAATAARVSFMCARVAPLRVPSTFPLPLLRADSACGSERLAWQANPRSR